MVQAYYVCKNELFDVNIPFSFQQRKSLYFSPKEFNNCVVVCPNIFQLIDPPQALFDKDNIINYSY